MGKPHSNLSHSQPFRSIVPLALFPSTGSIFCHRLSSWDGRQMLWLWFRLGVRNLGWSPGTVSCLHLCYIVVQSLGRVQPFATPWTVARRSPPSMGFPRQEHWSGLPFPSPGDLPDPVGKTSGTWVSYIRRRVLYHWATRAAQRLLLILSDSQFRPRGREVTEYLCYQVVVRIGKITG